MSARAGRYTGPWPPWPGMYPVLILHSGRTSMVAVWDADATRRMVEADVRRLVPVEVDEVALHFGYPSEIIDHVRELQSTGPVVFDLTGISAATEAAFAGLLTDTLMVSVGSPSAQEKQ